ncbi:MAG: sugar phosphate isomerase/epimerase, partial [Clostridia bacterium]|nr:sugar phosphate isomerase/epimerase [Clostridia bacterium]
AEALGAKLMRHDAAWRAPDKNPELTFDDVLPTLAAGCRAVTEYAAEKGIRTMTENHGRFAQGSERMIRLVKAVDHPNYGILIDMGNVTGIDEHPLSAVKAMLPYAFHVHCKDFFILPGTADPGAGYNLTEHGNYTRPTIVGHGNVDVKACIKAVKESGYQGAMMLEFEGMEEPLEAVRIGHDNMRRYWEEA